MTDDLNFDETPFIEPAPDEEAWEAVLTLALERLDADGSTGLTNAQLSDVETAAGATLPFEVGLLLVMGVPDTDGWVDWRVDPQSIVSRWAARTTAIVLTAVEHDGRWWPEFGARPDDPATRLETARQAMATVTPTLPLYRHHAVPLLGPAAGDELATAVLDMADIDVQLSGRDLAEWMHRLFDVPLPMWPEAASPDIGFWSDFIGPA